VTALAIVVWESVTTGALDPNRVASSGAAPVLLLVPALAFFAVAVVLLRVVPYALRAAARATRNARPGISLAFLTAARNPAQVAAATTFLAVAVGTSLFSLDYRATLDRQAADHANFVVGAPWRTRTFDGAGAPVLRLDGRVEDVAAQHEPDPATTLGVPAAQIPQLRGWRAGFSALSRSQIARRVRPLPVRMRGLRLADDARELRVPARAQTDYPRRLVLHVLLRTQRFEHVTVGLIPRRRTLLRIPVPASLRGGQIVAVGFEATYVPISFKYDPSGFVDLGPLEQRTAGGWTTLPSLVGWVASTAPTGTAGAVNATRSGIRFEILGTRQPLIHPRFGLPSVRSGFVSGEVPAVASEPLARRAVDGLLVLDLEGIQLPVRVVGRARLFPTVVTRPSNFLVFDYDTLFATLNADEPGRDVPAEALHFGGRPRTGISAAALRRSLESDPLAAGMRQVLGVAGIVAAVLGLLGLALATRLALGSERLQIAEYEALGVTPTSLRRSAQLRLMALSAFGIVAAVLGALLSGRLIGAFVAVTGTARKPLPPIASVVEWLTLTIVVVALAAAGGAAALLVTRRALRDAPAKRLRA
jgi:FtsX-like permease family